MPVPLLLGALVLAVLLLVAILRLTRRRPRNDRDWTPDVARLARGEIDGDTLTLHNVRDTHYGPPGTPYEVRWTVRSYDLSTLQRLWLVVESFSRFRAIAHTFLSFEFADVEALSVSVEARLPRGESYSIVRGLLRTFEVAYTFGVERDFVLKRAAYKGRDMLLLPLITPPVQVRQLLQDMVATANALGERPRFYNSVSENCTSTLADHANEVRPGSFPRLLPAKVMPGLAPATLYRKGWIDSDLPLESLEQHFEIGERARAIGATPDFSRRLRRELLLERAAAVNATGRAGQAMDR